MPDRNCTGCPGGCIYCISRNFDRTMQERDRYRDAIRHAIDVLGPGDEEDGDSPSNMAFAILGHALSRGETNA